MKHRKTFGEINITPLTDIFLVLLIIMMVVTPMEDYKGLNLAVLTAGEAAEAAEVPKTLLVQINAIGEYTVAGAAVPREQLADTLRTQSAQNPEGVVIEVDPEATHEAITCALAAAEQAGVTKLAVSQKEAKPVEFLPPKAEASKKPKK